MCREISPDLLFSSLSILSSPARYGHSAMEDPPLPLSVIIIKSTSFAFIERLDGAARSRQNSCRCRFARATDGQSKKLADENLCFDKSCEYLITC